MFSKNAQKVVYTFAFLPFLLVPLSFVLGYFYGTEVAIIPLTVYVYTVLTVSVLGSAYSVGQLFFKGKA